MWPYLLQGFGGRLWIIKYLVPNNLRPITMPIYLTERMVGFANIAMTLLTFFCPGFLTLRDESDFLRRWQNSILLL